MTIIPVKRALLSVSDKTDISSFAQALNALNIEIISTGGTSQVLREKKITHQQVESITQFPEMLGGRVKTLHPKIHGGILGRRDQHALEAQKHDIAWIDLVVVNFYPFAAMQDKHLTWEELVEYIDIGGPTMVRAAAKNFAWVGVIVDPQDYPKILIELEKQNGISYALRKTLAQKAFELTSDYDAMIHRLFAKDKNEGFKFPEEIKISAKKHADLRYGENPHQKAAAYRFTQHASILAAQQYQGKELSFNNILDADAAWQIVSQFTEPSCVVVKHNNPCGVASRQTIEEACENALLADAQSAFGGVVALNQPCNKEVAAILTQRFIEMVIAPDYSEEALQVFQQKSNLRLLKLLLENQRANEIKFISGGFLLQEKDQHILQAQDLKIVTKTIPQPSEIDDLLFAWKVLKHIKSNAILIAKNKTTLGIGAGQVSRIDAVDIAIRKSKKNMQSAILASDAFFPFRDSIDRIGETPIRTIIQPGGSKQDAEVIKACDEHCIAMVFTDKRCFKH